MNYDFPSSDPELLQKANRVAHDFADQFLDEDILGIVFIGAIVRGYFDHHADIDLAIYKQSGAKLPLDGQFHRMEGLEIHCHVMDYDDELKAPWDMAKRWTFSEGHIHYDPQGQVARLLAEKVPLTDDERRWLVMSGLTLSEWYINRLTDLWIERGDLTTAHYMFFQGLNFFFDLLFGWNHKLVPDMKWRLFQVQQLPVLPAGFHEMVKKVLMVNALSMDEIERRKQAFMTVWQEMRPLVEQELELTYEQIISLV